MKIEKVVVGKQIPENCYIINKDNKCLVVDPGDEVEKILEIIKEKEVKAILITHYHFDHIGALNYLKEKYNPKIYDFSTKEETITLNPFTFKLIKTPGHKEDCTTFYFEDEKIMFTGDFLFYHTIGRCDLEESNYNDMLKSIKKIKMYDKNIKVYPGHGKDTTLEEEFKNNEYFN